MVPGLLQARLKIVTTQPLKVCGSYESYAEIQQLCGSVDLVSRATHPHLLASMSCAIWGGAGAKAQTR